MKTAGNLPPPARIAMIAAAVVIVLAGIRAATPILAPLLVAVFFAMITAPLMKWLTRRGAPPVIAAAAVVAGLIGLFAAAVAFLGVAFAGFIRSLPQYRESFLEQVTVLADYGIDIGSFTIWD
ncbi:MAG: AI-2E family transporter, partial [Methanoculleus sp.]